MAEASGESGTARALEVLNELRGCDLRAVSAMPEGEASHATVVEDGNGRRSLLKWWRAWGGEHDSLEYLERVVPRVDRLRARGFPAPAYLVTAASADLLFIVQELLPGRPPDPLLPVHVEQLTALNALQEDDGEGGSGWGEYMVRTLTEGADGYCLHAPLRAFSRDGAALLDRITRIGRETPPDSLPAPGTAHCDFHHLNVLTEGERVSGVVDCEGCRAGDPCFDLVTLHFCSAEGGLGDAAQRRLWESIAARRPAPVLRAYVAHMALRLSSWSAVHHDRATTERWLARSEVALDGVGIRFRTQA
jgi:aminoglycoside phosphotransferase (APT) family kinase protein